MQSSYTELQITPGRLEWLRVPQIVDSKFRIRRELGNLEDLKISISQKGILQPIMVRPLESSMYEVVTGSRRLAAIRELGYLVIPVFVAFLDDRASFEIMLTENIQRETLGPLDEARAFYTYVGPREKKCLAFGKVSELANRIGKSQEYVSNRIRLLRLPEHLLRQLFANKNFTASHAEELASLAGRPELVERLSGFLLQTEVSVVALKRAISLMKTGIDCERALVLAEEESNLGLKWNHVERSGHTSELLMDRTESILKHVLSYIDDVTPDLEFDGPLREKWISEVRLKVHSAIDGVIRCRNSAHDRGRGQSL